MKIGVARFPGTNCDADVLTFARFKEHQSQYIWHTNQFDKNDFDLVIIPGGFSYGDYLRSGALAARSPVMNSVREFAQFGKPVFGICNGFQILCEAGLLPGALVRNESGKFIDDWIHLKIKNKNSFITKKLVSDQKIKLPIAHGDGRFVCDQKTLEGLNENGQIWVEYIENPNGSVQNIAGIMNLQKNVSALMPHPERAQYPWMGGIDGLEFL
jgi:phosphoribosylformylglycinamidine synthase I